MVAILAWFVSLLCLFCQGASDEASDLASLSKEIQALQRELLALRIQYEEDTAARDEEIAHLKTMVTQNTSTQIAFSVVADEDFGPVTVPTQIPFSVINVNVGNGWQPSISTFEAPVAGFYVFIVSVASNNEATDAVVVYTEGGSEHKLVSTVSTSGVMGDANAGVVHLEAGAYVNVRLLPDGGGIVKSDPDYLYTSFSGFLLFV